MVQFTLVGEANGGRVIKLEEGVTDLGFARGGTEVAGVIQDAFGGPDVDFFSKPYTPLGESGICQFRRIFLAIRHTAGFKVLVIPYVDGIELVDLEGDDQQVQLTVAAPVGPGEIAYIEIPVSGRGTSLQFRIRTGVIAGDFYIEGAGIGFTPVRTSLLD